MGLSPKKMFDALVFMIQNKEPIMLVGSPGCGKTELVKQACKATKNKLVIMHPVVSSPTDFKGLPFLSSDGESADFMPYGDLKILVDAKEKTVFFLDDLGQSSASVQAACMQLILERKLNGHKISDNITFISATNRTTDRAAVTSVLEPLKSRNIVIELDISVDDWVDWAMKNKMPETIISFVRFKPDSITKFVPSKHIVNTSSPRTVATVGRLINMGIPEDCLLDIITGAAGAGFAIEYIAFSNVYGSIPTFAEILRNPKTCKMPSTVDEKYAISGMISYNASNAKTFDMVMDYIYRLPIEFQVQIVKETIRLHKGACNAKKFDEWNSKHKELILEGE